MIGFRVDANENIATGHLMRCLVLADQLREMGEECVFLLADRCFEQHVKERAFRCVVLAGTWDDWDADIGEVCSCVERLGISCLIVDSYQATESFLSELNQRVPVVYIDDLCKQAYTVSMLVCFTQSNRAGRIPELYQDSTVKILLGSKYLLLRKEFFPEKETGCTEGGNRIMITTGGTDPYHITLKFVRACLSDPFFEEYSFLAVLGAMNRDGEELALLSRGKKLELFKNINNMGEMMRSCCAAVSAGGVTIYELCACQIPTVCIAFSDDQAGLGENLSQRGVLQYAGDIREHSDRTIREAVQKLRLILSDSTYSSLCRREMSQCIDGMGAYRIAEEILHLSNYKKERKIIMKEYFEKTRAFWGQEIIRGDLKWPNANVIRFVKRNVAPGSTILDFGCGGGRNTLALSAEGYQCIAMDYTQQAVETVRKKTEAAGYEVTVLQNHGLEVCLPDNSVDAIVSDGSLFYNDTGDTEILLTNLRKCLKDGGVMWADFRSERDSLFGRGERIGDGLYRLEENTGREGCSYLFVSRDMLSHMYQAAGFHALSIDSFEYTEQNGERLCSWFHVTAQK